MDGLGTPILDGLVFQNKPVEGFYSHVTCVLVNDLHVSSFFKIWGLELHVSWGTWHHRHHCIVKRFQIFADVADVIAVPTTHRKSGKPDNKSCPIGFILLVYHINVFFCFLPGKGIR